MEAWIRHYQALSNPDQREAFLHTLVQHYTELFDATEAGYLLLDDRERVLSHNTLASELIGHDLQIGDAMPRPGDLFELEETFADEGGDPDDNWIHRTLEDAQPRQHILSLRRDGERHWLRLTALPVKLADAPQVLMVLQDISAEKRLQADVEAKQQLLDRARTRDALTGLHNRRFILEELDHLNAQAKRYDTRFSIALIDLDHFKSVNDTYGHDAADRVLLSLAGLIQDELRDADISARYGAEEFMILLPETGITAAVSTINRLRQRFTETRVEGIKRSLTLSAGVMEWLPGQSREQLVFKTDQRLSMAKYAGRNQVCGNIDV